MRHLDLFIGIGGFAYAADQVQATGPDWDRDWTEVAAEFCSLDDGLPAGLGELKLTKAQHRNEQIKAYGNAIVPQVAIEIMRAIKEVP